jgi:hypothetical protein
MSGDRTRIFINYRRTDSAAAAGRLADRLRNHFDRDAVFMDVEGGISGGEDFTAVIDTAIQAAVAMVVVIGRSWLTCTNERGERRLDEPQDPVVREIVAGLDRRILVLPVLVDGASMPAAAKLPTALRPLARRQACEISGTRWTDDVARIVETLARVVPASGDEGASRGGVPAAKSVNPSAEMRLYTEIAPAAEPGDTGEPQRRLVADLTNLGAQGEFWLRLHSDDFPHPKGLKNLVGRWRDSRFKRMTLGTGETETALIATLIKNESVSSTQYQFVIHGLNDDITPGYFIADTPQARFNLHNTMCHLAVIVLSEPPMPMPLSKDLIFQGLAISERDGASRFDMTKG